MSILSERACGVLLHPTSLPGPHGTGDLGPAAFRFADALAHALQSWWQMLPIGPPGFANSPYAALSAFAGNPALISLEKLSEDGLLSAKEIMPAGGADPLRVRFEMVTAYKLKLLRKAARSFEDGAQPDACRAFEGFCEVNAGWLDDYALFMALKGAEGDRPWTEWPPAVRGRDPAALVAARDGLESEVRFQKFMQYSFERQWTALKGYCNGRGIRLMGDMPIFVNQDSSDVWSHQDMFQLDHAGHPVAVAGVPPDYFSAAGQRWGNPLYRWDLMSGNGFRWWTDRFRRALFLFDATRLDHFIGFHRCWEIPAGAGSAREGRYAEGPGENFFAAVLRQVGKLPLVAEDLGIVTPEVAALRERFGFPGMRVLQFAFGGAADGLNPYLLHNCAPKSVIYTGTHDNDTTVGWYAGTEGRGSTRSKEQAAHEREAFIAYIGRETAEPNWEMIRLALMSVCSIAIVPVQDILGLGSEARMNVPGIDEGNWGWRMEEGALTDAVVGRLAGMTRMHGRVRAKG